MKCFRFRLERVLSHRKMREEKLRSELVSIDESIRGRRRHLALWQEKKNANHSALQSRQCAGIKGWETHLYSQFLRRIEEEISSHHQALEKLRTWRSEHQKELQLASRERKVMEKLKAKEWHKFRSRVLHEEQKLADEAAIRGFYIQRSGHGNPLAWRP